ncbi:MAG: metallophosphoesterase [Candidatus Micrarchaeia archaeon]
MRFLTDKPAVLLGDTLVIADIHLGIEREVFGVRVSFTENTRDEILGLIQKTNAKKLLILGDVKHSIAGRRVLGGFEIKNFLQSINRVAEVEIVKGNHDGRIESLTNAITIHGAGGVKHGKYGFVHGHSWPKSEVMMADYIFLGHVHPVVDVADISGYRKRMRVWVVCKMNVKNAKKFYKRINPKATFIIVPAFTELAGGGVLNDLAIRKLGPLLRNEIFKIDDAEIYLLSGVKLSLKSKR